MLLKETIPNNNIRGLYFIIQKPKGSYSFLSSTGNDRLGLN